METFFMNTENKKYKIGIQKQYQLGMILLIYLMVLTQFLIFKIILNLSLKNMKVKLKIELYLK